jgi:hypothetical protein
MFDSREESLVLEIVRGFFGISSDDTMKIGDMTKKLLFDPEVDSEEAAAKQIKAALADMSKEQALITGMFISGLLRCNLAQQVNQGFEEAMAAENEAALAEEKEEPKSE